MIIKTIATRKSIMHRIFGDRFAPRLRLGLTDIERRMMEEKRRLRESGIIFIIILAVCCVLLDISR